jgi:thioredoxin 1
MNERQSMIYNVTEGDFRQNVIEASHERPVLVDFWADWCSPCLVLAPELEGVITEYEGKIALAKVEVDDNMRLAGHYRLRGFPTVIGFVAGEEVARFASARKKSWIRDFITEHFP